MKKAENYYFLKPLKEPFQNLFLQLCKYLIIAGVTIDSISMLYEYSPVTDRGSFRFSDDQVNKVYEVAKYTFHLNTREFFIDGIKRDRWIWSGDAYQSYLMNYYLFFDSPTVKRTLAALRSKDPVTSHINTIMDYTFYWFLGIYGYYLYTGNKKFIRNLKSKTDDAISLFSNKNAIEEIIIALRGLCREVQMQQQKNSLK